ncbi:uncharacterized protein LOC110368046 [Fundulus heteroclitus]|uniref:uncharacterized protein LOC110368046 n=1 Tax=Fundulus heteroclitus TaxID=8078 RepID=UPI00165B78F6|nr:uncharacterized protein LOC110368046 [Fundulus heteroclitus]
MMIIIFMTFTAFASAGLIKESFECIFSNSAGNQKCYGAEGQQLIFHLTNANNSEITLLKDGVYRILKTDKNGTVTVNKEYLNQFEQIQPGTFRLGKAMKKHSGMYSLEEYGTDGTKHRKVQVSLKIQGPVSKPAISESCFSPEQKTVTCSSYGDEVESFLALDGHLLIQSRDHRMSISDWTNERLNVSNIWININGQLTGGLMCQVWNNVSREESVYHLTACKGSDTVAVPVLAILIAVLCVVLGYTVFTLCKKRRPMPSNEGIAEDEIIYADVKIQRTTKQDTESNAE